MTIERDQNCRAVIKVRGALVSGASRMGGPSSDATVSPAIQAVYVTLQRILLGTGLGHSYSRTDCTHGIVHMGGQK